MHSQKIQKALAALITNPLYALNFEELNEQIGEQLQLSTQEMEELFKFYKINNHRFTASSKILSKNRWDNVKQSLPIICKFISRGKLDEIWHQHLYKKNLDLLTPKNPLMESLVFCKYLLQSKNLSDQERQIVKYEYIRNEVTYSHHERFDINIPRRIDITSDSNFAAYAIYFDKSYQVHEFELDLFMLLRKQELVYEKTKILFFKNLTKEGVGSIKLNDKISLIMELAVYRKNVSEIMNSLAVSSREIFINLLKQLTDCGLLYITNLNEVQ